jgi:nucleoside-diphosphate-sugar epimerase
LKKAEENAAMRILILGGTRFIGPHVVRRLHHEGHHVAVFHRGRTQAELPGDILHLIGVRLDLSASTTAFRSFAPQVVVDMIAYTEADARSLVATFRGLAERTVILSSGDVYRAYGRFIGTEPGPVEAVPLAEDAPLREVFFPYRSMAKTPDDLEYGYDKIPVERVVLAEPDLPATVLRLPMVYGPDDYQHRLYDYLRRMDDGRRAILLDERMAGWRCTRGYVEDVAAAIVLAIRDPRAAGQIYNVGEATAWTEAEWMRRIGQVVGWRGQVVTVPPGRLAVPGNVEQDLVMETSRIRRELGYTEMTSPMEALTRTVEWERRHPPDNRQVDYQMEDRLLTELAL